MILELDFKPECKYGHGPLLLAPGLWALTGVVMHQMTPSTLLGPTEAPVPTNEGYVCHVFRCARCGYMELFDYK